MNYQNIIKEIGEVFLLSLFLGMPLPRRMNLI